ncbi:5'-nucleotidase SurE [subsurface metagenome]
MKILATNDDGIFADGLKALVGELKSIADVIVVAPDRELHSMGASVSLHEPVRVKKTAPLIEGVESYAVEGTPADCVILALGKLAKDKIDLVVSGVNRGLNLGDDVIISGTVGAALQGSVHGLPAIAVSAPLSDNPNFEDAARFAALVIKRFESGSIKANTCLNVNLPNLPREKIRGVKFTYPASRNHTDTVEERYAGKRQYYWFVRQRVNKPTDEKTDTWAIEKGNISISPLLVTPANRSHKSITDSLCSELFEEFKQL